MSEGLAGERRRVAVDAAALAFEKVGMTPGWMTRVGLAANSAVIAAGYTRLSQRERRVVVGVVEAIWRTNELPS